MYSLVLIYLMSWIAECIAWAVVILTQLGFIGAPVFFMGKYFLSKVSVDPTGQVGEGALLELGIVFSILAFVFMFMICCGFYP